MFGIQAVRLFYVRQPVRRPIGICRRALRRSGERGPRPEKPQLTKAGKEADYLSAQGAFVNIAK